MINLQGEEGSPIVYKADDKFHLVGVVSYGACGYQQTATVATRVSQYLDWIGPYVAEGTG